jgi:hypothetical protein
VTEFCFEHDFRAPSVASIFEAYFGLTPEEDIRLEVTREILELDDAPERLRRVSRVRPKRQVPAVLRPFVDGDLSFTERVEWIKARDLIETRIEPSLWNGKVEITGEYRVAAREDGVVRRTFEGHVSVQVRLVGRRIERAIVEDLGRSMAQAAQVTQAWLDRERGTSL